MASLLGQLVGTSPRHRSTKFLSSFGASIKLDLVEWKVMQTGRLKIMLRMQMTGKILEVAGVLLNFTCDNKKQHVQSSTLRIYPFLLETKYSYIYNY